MMSEITTPSPAQKPSLSSVFSWLKSEPAVLILLFGIAAVAVLDNAQLIPSISFTIDALISMAPYFAIAIGFAAYAKASGLDGLVAKAFSGNPAAAIVIASLAGAMSPFCSCGVIPLIAAMLTAGVPLAPVMAFWIASPIMDPEMFLLTAAGIGWNFAIAKTIAAIVMGLMAGFATHALRNAAFLANPMHETSASGGCGSSCSPGFDANAPVKVYWKFWEHPERTGDFFDNAKTNGWFLGKWLTLAFFIESVMIAYIPADLVATAIGESNPFAIPLTAIIGMPSYLNGYAAIPLTAGLLKLGMAPGAAMTFMTAGAVSSIPAAVAVYAIVRKPVFALYVVLGLTGAILSGYAFQFSGGIL
ncbi:MAG: permease [Hyphomicrobiales bacterium]